MATINDLPAELLQCILILVVQSAGGAEDFARVTSVSQRFRRLSEAAEIEKVVPFDNMSISNLHESLLSNNFLFGFARRGNLSAQHLLSKILLVICSQKYVKSEARTPTDEDISATNFVARVLRDPTFTRHWELVRSFLRRCSPGEFAEMGEHLMNYINFFVREKTSLHNDLEYCIEGMILLGKAVADAVEVDLNAMEAMLDEKNKALDILWDLERDTSSESSSSMQITDYAVREEALINEIDELCSTMSTIYEYGDISERGGAHETDPAIYFEEGRAEALFLFRFLFPEPV